MFILHNGQATLFKDKLNEAYPFTITNGIYDPIVKQLNHFLSNHFFKSGI